MKTTTAIIVGLLASLTATAVADKPHPKKQLMLGDAYDLAPRHAAMPRDVEAAAKPRTRSDGQVAVVVKSKLPDIQYCWNRLPALKRSADVTAVLRLSVEAKGNVTGAEIGGDVPADAQSCINDAVRRWTFPAADALSQIEYAVALRAM